MDKVMRVKPLLDGKVYVEMSNGRCGEFDVRPYMESTFFRHLQDESYFNQVKPVFSGIGWPDGQDLGPDTIAAELLLKVNEVPDQGRI